MENPKDRGAWWATVYGGRTESDTTEATAAAAAMQEIPVQSLGKEDLLERGSATHSSILGLPW